MVQHSLIWLQLLTSPWRYFFGRYYFFGDQPEVPANVYSKIYILSFIYSKSKTHTRLDIVETIKANEFLLRVENAAASVGLHMNEGKTKVMTLNMEDRSSDL